MAATRHLRLLAAALLLALVPACHHRRNCVPEELARGPLADLCGPVADEPSPPGLPQEVMDLAVRRTQPHHPPGARPYQLLALSAGGLYGSFGVGVLNGWSEAGTRPTFDIVTGISVGAIQATYAFLGPEYDDRLREEIVGVERPDILRRKPLPALLCSESIYSPERFIRRLHRSITPELLCEVAKAHAAGRRLYVGTCNLDRQALVIWDMGAIASRGTPEALELYRKVVQASASIPGALPPVELPVEIDGHHYTELHSDGGAAEEAFFRPWMVIDLNRRLGHASPYAPPGSRMHIVINGKLYSDPRCARPKLIALAVAGGRSLLDNKGRDVTHRIYYDCLTVGVDYRLAPIPQDLPLTARNALDVKRDEQELLYATGRQIGRAAPAGPGWREIPPGDGEDPGRQSLPRSGLRFATKPVSPPAAAARTSASSPPAPAR